MVTATIESRHIIHTFIDQSKIKVPENVSPEDLSFWKDQGFPQEKVPEKIVIATGSTRKLIMAYCLLNGFIFPNQIDELANQYDDGPLGLQQLFSDKVHNGDGSYKEGEILVGLFHGIPVYGRSTEGETKGNDAMQEATNKATYAYKQYYEGENVIVISGDAVDKVEVSGSEILLGKPMNMENFPKKDNFEDLALYDEAVTRYLHAYVLIFFQQKQEVQHISAVAAFHGLSGEVRKLENILITAIPSIEEMEGVKADSGAGGGAVFQQLFDFEQFNYLSTDEKIRWIWIIYCMIAGMPVFSMLGAATEFGKQIKVWQKDEKVIEI